MGMFSGARNFNQDISKWDVSKVTKMTSMFFEATNFNQDISKWDVSKVTRMMSMFSGAKNFNQDISHWDVSSVTHEYGFKCMFEGATSFNQVLCGAFWVQSTWAAATTDMFVGNSPGSI